MPLYTGPVEERPFARPLERWGYDRGRTVYRAGGTWMIGSDFDWATIAAADVVPVADRPGGERTDGTDRDRFLFIGGKEYDVSDAVFDALVAAGFASVGSVFYDVGGTVYDDVGVRFDD